MATISGDLKTKFTDDLGEPLVGGKVYTYHAGTSTPKDSYKDKSFEVPNSNPIILDDAGSCDLYLNGLYRLRVLDKDGVFVEERDYMTQGDSTGSSITDNANNIAVLQSEVQAINERSVLKLDENNFVIGHGSANSATVHDPAFRVDKLKIAKKDDAESAKLLFNTYGKGAQVEGETVKEGSYIDPDLITQPLVKNWRDVERAAFKGTKKDSKTNLLLKVGDTVPGNSAASKLVGTADGQIPLAEDIQAVAFGRDIEIAAEGVDAANLKKGFIYTNSNTTGLPSQVGSSKLGVLNTFAGYYSATGPTDSQYFYSYFDDNIYFRGRRFRDPAYRDWRLIHHSGNTTKDNKTNLLLRAGDAIPENSAASKLVGMEEGNLVLQENIQAVAFGRSIRAYDTGSASGAPAGYVFAGPAVTGKPENISRGILNTFSGYHSSSGPTDSQYFYSYFDDNIYFRGRRFGDSDYRPWRLMHHSGNTTKDNKTNLLLRAGDAIPENSAASRLVGTNTGNVVEIAEGGRGIGGSGILGTEAPDFVDNGSSTRTTFFSNSELNQAPSNWQAKELVGGWVVNRGSRPVAFFFGNRAELQMSHYAGSAWSSPLVFYHSGNTTKDTATGFLKVSSPVLHVYNDSITKIHEAEQLDITVDKKGVGHYEIHGTTGLRKNDGWYMSPPRDVHGNVLCMVDLDEKDGVVILKTYKKKFDFETVAIVHDWDNPMNIPDGVCVEFRFNDLPEELTNQEQTNETTE